MGHFTPNTQTIPKVSTTNDTDIVLNVRCGVEDIVFSAANKSRTVMFYLKLSFADLTSIMFSLCIKMLAVHILNML